MQDFNKEILETMKKQVKEIKSIYEVSDYCKNGNRIANGEYLIKYPSHKDLLSIMERAVYILEANIISDYNEFIVENVLNDIEFIIGQNVLTEAHVQRLLLGPVTLQNFPIFKTKVEGIKDRVNDLYNCNLINHYYKYDEFKASLPFNYQQLESYMRYNKVGYEEELINYEYNGDYIYESTIVDINEELVKKISESYENLKSIDMIDKFRLEQHGLNPILEFNKKFVHYKNGKQYNLYKVKDEYFMITESTKGFKSYKITLHEDPVNITLESLYRRK